MIHEDYIKSISFKIGNKNITPEQAKQILNNRVYKIEIDLPESKKITEK